MAPVEDLLWNFACATRSKNVVRRPNGNSSHTCEVRVFPALECLRVITGGKLVQMSSHIDRTTSNDNYILHQLIGKGDRDGMQFLSDEIIEDGI